MSVKAGDSNGARRADNLALYNRGSEKPNIDDLRRLPVYTGLNLERRDH